MKENMHHRVARFREQQVTSCCPYSIVCSPRHRFRNKTHSCPCTGLVCCPAVLNFLSLSFREKRFYQQRYSLQSHHTYSPLSPLRRPRACFVTFLEPTDTATLHSTSNHHSPPHPSHPADTPSTPSTPSMAVQAPHQSGLPTRPVTTSTGTMTSTAAEGGASRTSLALASSGTLRLRAVAATDRHIQWAEDVIDNEGMGKKSSKGV